MNRRRFVRNSLMLGGAAPWALGRWSPVQGALLPPTGVDGVRLNAEIQELRRFGGTPDGGTHRVAYSDEDLGGREWVLARMRDAGFTTRVDPAGNLVGTLPGTDADLPALAVGSHIDTVPYGGSYDGTIGVLAGVELARTLHAENQRLRHPLRLYVFQNEEGGKTGSRLLIGAVEPSELDIVTASGFTIGEGIARLGGAPDPLTAARASTGPLAAFVELHIEQGATLERAGVPIGVVEGIVGIRRWFVTVTGEKNHAGTTPMDQRRDALVAASRMVSAVDEVALRIEGRQVATVGRLEVDPGAPNVIPGSVRFTLEIRDLSMEGIEGVLRAIQARAERIATDRGVAVDFEPFYVSEAAPAAEGLRRAVEGAAEGLGLRHMRLPSGAGHDAQSMAKLCPMGMIFVPSRGGISHAPDEFTEADQITAGANALLGTALELDRALG
ncbi:MAG: Zn-dependent hydrolase [Gemmatimonadetes bacterium]|nr:Zn-dependent hydrolase [Gemmatimonadota bacterium]